MRPEHWEKDTSSHDATLVSITPMCGLHSTQLEVSGRPTLTSEPNTDEDGSIVGWFVDLSEFACPVVGRVIDVLITDQSIDNVMDQDNESWYMEVQLWTNKMGEQRHG